MESKSKRLGIARIFLLLIAGFFFFGCSSGPKPQKAVIDRSITPVNGGTLVRINNQSKIAVRIYINDLVYLSTFGKSGEFVIPNGNHTIFALGYGLLLRSGTDLSTRISFTAESNDLSFTILGGNRQFDIRQDD